MARNSNRADWIAFGAFAARVRQKRRELRRRFDQLTDRISKQEYSARRTAWRLDGGLICRHGAFFASGQRDACPCMKESAISDDWRYARKMPQLDHETKALIVVPFHRDGFKRIGQLHAQMRRLNYT